MKIVSQTLFRKQAIELLLEREYERFDVDFRLYNASKHRQDYNLPEN